jgi:hypothetical protein
MISRQYSMKFRHFVISLLQQRHHQTFRPNLRSKSFSTAMTFAASISIAGLPWTIRAPDFSLNGASEACSLGSQVAISPVALEYAGWRDNVV